VGVIVLTNEKQASVPSETPATFAARRDCLQIFYVVFTVGGTGIIAPANVTNLKE
jgi:hypothetical protein